jgi:transcriptional regulator with XRE-family HTH domain
VQNALKELEMRKLKNRIPELLIEKERRDKRRYSQRDMAKGTNLTDAAISRFMRYETIDSIAYGSALVIAEWLGVSMEELSERE